MAQEGHLDLLEDSRFIEIEPVYADMIPEVLNWHVAQDEYLCDELIGFYQSEVKYLKSLSKSVFDLFVKATDHILARPDGLYDIGIPKVLHAAIKHSWAKRDSKHPFLYGRFDIIGGLNGQKGKVIEFNADTCTMVPETFYWQNIQLKHANKNLRGFNLLQLDIAGKMRKIAESFPDRKPVILGTTLGHDDDKANLKAIIDNLRVADQYFCFEMNLEEVIFSEEGAFIEEDGEYIPVDVLLKLFPWDWIYTEEPGLAELLANLVLEDKLMILSPPYSAVWQNKRFLNYITEHFPENNIVAKSYDNPDQLDEYVVKSAHGRLGEEVTVRPKKLKKVKHKIETYQEYLPLPKDEEGNSYQLGVFFTEEPSSLNVRCHEDEVVDDDCEFYSHYIIDA